MFSTISRFKNQYLLQLALVAVAVLDYLGYLHLGHSGIPIFGAILLGQGIVPGAGAVASELTAITRRAFVPKMVVQIWNSSPTMGSLIGSAQPAYGGISSVTVPVQGAPLVTGGWSGYDGAFNQPSDQQGAFVTEQNLKLFVVPIPFLGMEGVLQMDHAVIPKIDAKMNDATNFTMDAFSTAIFNNTTNLQSFIGLPGAIDDGTNMNVYGNLNRTTNTWWQSKVYAATGSPTRQSLLQYIAGVVKNCGEKPSFAVTGIMTWALLAQDFQGLEQYVITPGSGFDKSGDEPRSGFDALMVAGVPVYGDPYCPEGTVYLPNTGYINLYIHVMGSFQFWGFESVLSNWQLGYVGALVVIAEMVNTKPKAMARIGGYNFLAG